MAESGTYTDATMDSRRRLADAMLKQGAEYSPIAHPYQGIARLANALFGGMGVNDLNKEAQEKDKGYSETLLKSLDAAGGATPAIPATAPAKSASSLTEFIKGREGFNANAYPDHKQTSIGYGTVAQPGETGLTPEEGGKRLDVEVGKARQLVQSFGAKLSPAQEDALTDLTYNAGTAWMNSGLGEAVRAGDWPKAADLFKQYNKASGQVQPGLVSRREALAGNFTAESPNSPVQGAPAQGQQPTQNPQTPASGQNPGVGTLPVVNPQVREQIRALVASPDHRARSMGARLLEKVLGGVAKPGTMEFGKQGAVFEGPDGKFYSMQFASSGQTLVRPIQAMGADGKPMDLSPAKGTKLVGDEIVNQATGATRRNVAGAIAGKEGAEERGKAQGKAQADLPRVEQNVKTFLKELDDLEKDEKLANVIGPMDARTPNIFSQGIQSRIDRLLGQTFLAAFESLRGGGQITEVEGAKATQAINRLSNQKMTEAEYRVAIAEARREVEALLELARTRAAGGAPAAAAPAGGGYKVLGVR